MPSTITSFAEDAVKMRYREPFLTAGLNAKQLYASHGTYRGFLLSDNISNNTITISPDSTHADHVAVYQTQTGFSLTIQTTGTLNVSLASLVDATEKTWVICLYAVYALGSATASEIRAYELSPTDEFTIAAENPELVVLGTVTIPASSAAPIPAENITHNLRSFAWKNVAPEAVPWSPVVRNATFEMGNAPGDWRSGRTIPHWEFGPGSSPTFYARWLAGLNGAGFANQIVFNPEATATAITTYLRQRLGVSVGSAARVRLKWAIDVTTAASLITSSSMDLVFKDDSGVTEYPISQALDLTVTTGGEVEYDQTFDVPAGADYLDRVEFNIVDGEWASTANAVYFSTIQVWVEKAADEGFDNYGSAVDASHLILRSVNPATDAPDNGATFLYDQATNELRLGAVDGTAATPKLTPQDGTLRLEGILDVDSITPFAFSGALAVADADGARVTAPVSTAGGAEYTLMWESVPSGEKGFRIYVSSTGSMVYTVNAWYDNTTDLWTKDVTGGPYATQMEMTEAEIYWRIRAGDTPWAQGSWTDYVSHVGAGVPPEILTLRGDIQTTSSGSFDIGTSTTQFGKAWLRELAIGVDPPSLPGSRLVTIKGNHANAPSANENVSEYISKYYGIWSRVGLQFKEEFDKESSIPAPWDVSLISGGGTGAQAIGATVPTTIFVEHNGANVGLYGYYTDTSVKFRLTDGLICRVRLDINPDFTQPEFGFFNTTSRGITIRPNVVDGGGAHDYRICRGGTMGSAPTQTISLFHDTLLGGGQRWWTFMLNNGNVYWLIDDAVPDPENPTSDISDSQQGAAAITIPSGLWSFGFACQGGGGGFGSNFYVDYVEIITFDRDG